MRGLSDLQALRRAGFAPVLVLLDADPGLPCLGGGRDPAHLVADPGDRADRLDLRCLVGLCVAVSGCDRRRVEALCAACTAAGAARVVSTLHNLISYPDGVEAVPARVTDTAGVLSWQT